MSGLPRSVRRIVFALVLLLVLEYLVLPQIAGARRSLGLLADVNLRYVLAGLVLEAASLVAYAQLTRGVLPRTGAPNLWTLLRIQLSTLAVSHVVPGGAAAGGGLGYRLLTGAGVSGSDAGFALATQSIGSAVVLNAILWLGLAVSIPIRGFNPLYATAAIVGVVVVGAFSFAVLALTRGEERAVRVLRAVARRVPFLDEDRIHRLVHQIAARLRTLTADRPLMVRTVGWAAANWLLDASALWVFLLAFGFRAPIDGLVVSYGLAYVLAAIPITPGGLGVVEAALTATLVGFGAERGVAVLGVISYRLVNFWLPIPFGAAAYLSLRMQPEARRADVLREVTTEAAKEAEDVRTWAERHGVRLAHTPPDDGVDTHPKDDQPRASDDV
jgi:putative heme transporter